MSRKFGPLVVAVVVLLALINSAVFVVDQTQQAVLVQLGAPVSGVLGSGLHFKIPFVQEAIFFENRLLDYDAAPAEVLTSDKKNLVVDNFAKWKIVDPLKFYQTVRNISGALARLDDIIYAEIRVELGRHVMADIISKVRSEIMKNVTERSDVMSRDYGISVVDVRIKRADLPQENERAVFGRMRTERERQAKKYRSEGQESSLKLKAEADRDRTVILAEAYRQAQELYGQGDAEATRLYAEVYSQEPEFFHLMRTLEAYRKALADKTTLLLSSDDEFLRIFKEGGIGPGPSAGREVKPPAESPAK
ncbi:MAG: protease modulator HflC [Thermodesulfobacteriota bacterium]